MTDDLIRRQAVMYCFKKWQPYMATRLWDFEQELSALPSVNQQEPKTDTLDKIRAEIKEWYWQADKQALAKDPCVVDAMIDLFIRTIDKYRTER